MSEHDAESQPEEAMSGSQGKTAGSDQARPFAAVETTPHEGLSPYGNGHMPADARERRRQQARAPGSLADGAGSSSLELWRYIRPLLRWWWLILICVASGGVAAYVGVRLTPRVYQSRTTIMIGQALQDPNASASDLYTGAALANFYVDYVKREPVLKSTLDTLGLGWEWWVLRDMVSSRVVPGTQLIEISVLDNDPYRAQALAAEVAQELILQSPATTDPDKAAEQQFVQSEMAELKANIQQSRAEIKALDDTIANGTSAHQIEEARSRQESLQTQIMAWETTYADLLVSQQKNAPNILSIVEPAQLLLRPVDPGLRTNLLMGMAMGLLLAVAAAFVLEYIDDTVKTDGDVRRTLGLMTLGRIPRLENEKGSSKAPVANQLRTPAAGAFRVLRTNLQFSSIDYALKTLIITSAGPQEGKSTVAANLAMTLANSGQRVILVDADLWRPTQHLLFDMHTDMGLTNLLLGEANLSEVLQATSAENLQVLPAGPLPPNPADLLGSRRMDYLIETLREQADVVIFDTPPVLVDADAVILAARVDAVVFVIYAGHTRRTAVLHCCEALNAVGAHLAGVALNGVREKSHSYGYYYAANGQRAKRPSRRASLLLRLLKKVQHKAPPAEKQVPVTAEATPPPAEE